MFNHLDQAGKKWVYLGFPFSKQDTVSLLENLLEKVDSTVSFYWAHFAETDWSQHRFGPDSDERKLALRDIDNAIKKIFYKMHKIYGSPPELLIFGDHGAVQIERYIDIQRELRKRISSHPFFF